MRSAMIRLKGHSLMPSYADIGPLDPWKFYVYRRSCPADSHGHTLVGSHGTGHGNSYVELFAALLGMTGTYLFCQAWHFSLVLLLAQLFPNGGC